MMMAMYRCATRRVLPLVLFGLFAVSCAQRDVETLDVRKTAIAPVRTIAIATISARPSLAEPLFRGHRGELAGVLSKFETEMTNALLAQGFNVMTVSQSGPIYNDSALEYEIAYLHNTPEFMARARGEEEVLSEARVLRKHTNRLIGKVDDRGTFLETRDAIDQMTSPNTRAFAERGVDYRMTLPRHTEHGGALDNRFMSDAARAAIGEITRDMGADAYLLIDGNLVLSARQEGFLLAGSTGGTRYVTVDGTAALIRNDGVILSMDALRSQSALPIGGVNQIPFSTERGRGIAGFQKAPDRYNLLEGNYQAIRAASIDLAKRYAQYREEGKKILLEAKPGAK